MQEGESIQCSSTYDWSEDRVLPCIRMAQGAINSPLSAASDFIDADTIAPILVILITIQD